MRCLSVRGPRWFKLVGIAAGDLLQGAGREVDGPNVVTAFESAVRGESDHRAVRRDTRLTIITVAGSDLLPPRAIGKHRPDMECSTCIGLNCDGVALDRPIWVRVLIVRRTPLFCRAPVIGMK